MNMQHLLGELLKSKLKLVLASFVFLSLMLSGCGGGGSSTTDTTKEKDSSSEVKKDEDVVEKPNTKPVANSQTLSVKENQSLNITLSGTDADGDTLKYIVEKPKNGTLSGTAPNIKYTPNSGFTGKDSFGFKVSDGKEYSTLKLITINVEKASTLEGSSKVLKTGQTKVYKDGDDGYYQKGVDRHFSRGSGIVTDIATGLQWQDDYSDNGGKIVEKQWLTTDNYQAKKYNDTSGDTATTYCQNLSLGGYSDWRLPSVKEFLTIVDSSKYGSAIFDTFENTASSIYWSSTTYASDTSDAWRVYFDAAYTSNGYKYNSFYVRCVRGGQ